MSYVDILMMEGETTEKMWIENGDLFVSSTLNRTWKAIMGGSCFDLIEITEDSHE